MGHNEDENLESEVYQNLTQPKNITLTNQKFTGFLFISCIIISMASFQFGYNIGSLNLISPHIIDLCEENYFKIYYERLAEYNEKEGIYATKKKQFDDGEKMLKEADRRRANYLNVMFSMNQTAIREEKEYVANKTKEIRQKYNMTIEQFTKFAKGKLEENRIKLKEGREKLDAAKIKLEEARAKLNVFRDVFWAFINSLFIIGGMIGAFTSKYVTDRFGYKKGILFHYLFTLIGFFQVLVLFFIQKSIALPILLKLSRLFYGIQGGMSCTLAPSYIYELSSPSLRNKTGIFHSIFLAFGILVSQIFSFSQILGNKELWLYILAIPIVPTILGSLLLVIFVPNAPRSLLDSRKEEEAKKVLVKLRNTKNVNNEIQQLYKELTENKEEKEKIRFIDLFKNKKYRIPVITSIILHAVQQLTGINAIFFYSQTIFQQAGVMTQYIQYAVFLTGLVNLISTCLFLPIIPKLSRKQSLILTMIIMSIVFILISIFIYFKNNQVFSYLSVACVLVYLICFSAGLGPIPFIYVDECFEKDARSSPMFLCIATNWICALILTLDFPFLIKLLGGYVFDIFAVILTLTVVLVIFKVPETNHRKSDEILEKYRGKK